MFDNDASGKYHEIMVAKFLIGTYPERPKERECHRDGRKKKAKSRSQHDTSTAEAYAQSLVDMFRVSEKELQSHRLKAAAAAGILRTYFDNIGQDIERVFWTSHGNDLRWLFGGDNKNPSDLVVRHRDRATNRTHLTGVILKNYKKRKINTAGNFGTNRLDELFRTNTRPIIDNMKRRVLENTRSFGIDINQSVERLHEIEKTIPDLLESNAAIMTEHCRDIVARYAGQTNMFGNDILKDVVVSMLQGEPTKIKKVYLTSYGSEIGKFSHDIYCHSDMIDKMIDIHNGHFQADINSTGRSITFAGRNGVTIASLYIKGRTGGGFTQPVGNVAGIYPGALVA